jgi:hypothetical protein
MKTRQNGFSRAYISEWIQTGITNN